MEDWARGEAAGVGLAGGTETDLNQCDLIFEAVSTYCVYVTVSVTENNKRVNPSHGRGASRHPVPAVTGSQQ